MESVPVFIIIFLASIVLALRSMKDIGEPKDLYKSIIRNKTVKGTIVFFKDKIRHYS